MNPIYSVSPSTLGPNSAMISSAAIPRGGGDRVVDLDSGGNAQENVATSSQAVDMDLVGANLAATPNTSPPSTLSMPTLPYLPPNQLSPSTIECIAMAAVAESNTIRPSTEQSAQVEDDNPMGSDLSQAAGDGISEHSATIEPYKMYICLPPHLESRSQSLGCTETEVDELDDDVPTTASIDNALAKSTIVPPAGESQNPSQMASDVATRVSASPGVQDQSPDSPDATPTSTDDVPLLPKKRRPAKSSKGRKHTPVQFKSLRNKDEDFKVRTLSIGSGPVWQCFQIWTATQNLKTFLKLAT
ncbi:hypothetical protein BD410DRAFT_838172 [Rickenella mellea]|uniref:Uncharacterized protein n=1 Tax=Rickenella mellea TaxID=50990 RepID=A0A4Y7QAQ2_9AGAM|nr:hypothetical protein BD410DRAFT_838172 [Rickenella mellea]